MVGVDIGSSSIKVVELSVNGRGDCCLERCASELLEPGAVLQGHVVRLDAVAEALRRALLKAGIRQRKAVLAVPTELTESQTISLPDGLDEDQLYAQVESEAQRLFTPAEKIHFDFVVIGPHDTEGGIGVHVTAVSSERVEERAAVAALAGLQPVVMDVEQFAWQRAAFHMTGCGLTGELSAERGAVVAYAHLGGSASRMVFYQQDKLLYEQALMVTGDGLTQQISRTFDLEPRKAEVKKRKQTLPNEYHAQLMQYAQETLLQELQGATQGYLASGVVPQVERIVLSGGHACLEGMTDWVGQRTGIATHLANPFARMGLAKGVNPRYMMRELPAYLIGSGLALRGLQVDPVAI